MMASPPPSSSIDPFNHYNTEVAKLDTKHCQEDESGNLRVPENPANEDRFALLSSDDDQASGFEIPSDSLNVIHPRTWLRPQILKTVSALTSISLFPNDHPEQVLH